MEIDRLDRASDKELEAFLDRLARTAPSVLGYHYPFYRDILEAAGVGEPFFLGAREAGALVGVLPGFVRETALGTVYSSLPFFGPNAGVLCAPGAGEEAIHEALLSALTARLQARGRVLSLSIYTPFMFDRFELYDRLLPGATVVDRRTQFLSLAGLCVPAKVRYDVRRAEKLGVEVTTEATPSRTMRFLDIYRENCREAGIPVKPAAVLEGVLSRGVAENRARLYFAEHGGATIAGLLVLWSPAVVSYYLPCTERQARPLQPSALLIDFAARDAARHGLRYWNWESSPEGDPGVYNFKARWGSTESAYRVYVVPAAGVAALRAAGREALSQAFPFFFVYPYDRL